MPPEGTCRPYDKAAIDVARPTDSAFIDYCNDCNAALNTPLEQSGRSIQSIIAEKTEALVSQWRMPDHRYPECQPDAMYGSYLLYLNESRDFCVVLDVFLPGQAAWIHNHLCWCLFTCLEGSERERLYHVEPDSSSQPEQTEERVCQVGKVRTIGAARNLFHQVECASDEPTVSLHVYGADIGNLERDMWNDDAGAFVKFRSGYSNEAAGLSVYLK